jgi:DNA-binding Lrp family transcriptional regulator
LVKAYVLIKTHTGTEDKVLQGLHELPFTEEAHKVFGPYDIVAEIKGRDMESIVEIVTSRIRKIAGVSDTHTLLVVDVELDMTQTGLAS